MDSFFKIYWMTLLCLHSAHSQESRPPQFIAYDCSSLYNIQEVTTISSSNCHSFVETPRRHNVDLLLLQREHSRVLQGWKCKIEKTEGPPTVTSLWKPLVISSSLCNRMWSEQTYIDPLGLQHSTLREMTTEIEYHDSKGSYSSRITLVSQTYLLGQDGRIITQDDKNLLPCNQEVKGCITETFTYGWSDPNPWCELALLKKIRGTLTGTREGDEDHTFTTTDYSAIRLEVHGEISICGQTVSNTNYPDLYLYSPQEDHPF